MIDTAAIGSAAFLVVAMSVAGFAHVAWLKSRWSRRFGQPLDGGLMFRGRRVFGANKMLRGLMAMPPASALAFAAFGATRERFPEWLVAGTWDLPAGQYALLGFACGLAFMIAELPNSFLKRQLDVAPGQVPRQKWLRPLCFVLDRTDSIVGVMVVVAVATPVTAQTWLWVFVLGAASHMLFSALLYGVGEKARPL